MLICWFAGPFNVPVTSYMKLTNPSDKKVMFKIKTTAPKKYCVRPNSGTLDSNASVEIASKYSFFIHNQNFYHIEVYVLDISLKLKLYTVWSTTIFRLKYLKHFKNKFWIFKFFIKLVLARIFSELADFRLYRKWVHLL